MKISLLAVLGLSLLASAAQADTITFPADEPVATVTFPDDWESEGTAAGALSTSPDGAISFYLDVADSTDVETVAAEAMKFLLENGVTVDPATQVTKDGEVAGMPASMIGFEGKDEGGEATIQLGIIQTAADKGLVFTYWGTKGDEDKYQDQIVAIMNSIKPTG